MITGLKTISANPCRSCFGSVSDLLPAFCLHYRFKMLLLVLSQFQRKHIASNYDAKETMICA